MRVLKLIVFDGNKTVTVRYLLAGACFARLDCLITIHQ